jgi:hypothetical protein
MIDENDDVYEEQHLLDFKVAKQGDLATEVVVEDESASSAIKQRQDKIAANLKAKLKRGKFEDVVGKLIRQAVDYVIDAPTMRRYALSDLESDEKTTIGKRIERLLRLTFDLKPGSRLDINLGGEEIDIKTSCTKSRSWMFSRRNVNHFNLLIAYNEDVATYDLGLVFVTDDILGADNRDKKRGIKGDKGAGLVKGLKGDAAKVKGSIEWMVKGHSYEPNFLAHLDPSVLKTIVEKNSGAARVRELLRQVINTPIPRHSIEAVANQKDAKRRDRGGDGGSRAPLWREGLMYLSGAFTGDNDIVEAITGTRLDSGQTIVFRVKDDRVTDELQFRYRDAHRLLDIAPVP